MLISIECVNLLICHLFVSNNQILLENDMKNKRFEKSKEIPSELRITAVFIATVFSIQFLFLYSFTR